jgi:hypothetical protein
MVITFPGRPASAPDFSQLSPAIIGAAGCGGIDGDQSLRRSAKLEKCCAKSFLCEENAGQS